MTPSRRYKNNSGNAVKSWHSEESRSKTPQTDPPSYPKAIAFILSTSSTAQGGGRSFKNRKPIGEVVCCESGMAARSRWWTERWLISLTISLSFSDYLPTYLPIYLSISLSLSSNYLSIYLSLSLLHLSSCLPVYLSIYLSTCLSVAQCHSVWCSVV